MSVPDAEQLAALADVLHTTVGELLGATLEHEESRDRLAEELALHQRAACNPKPPRATCAESHSRGLVRLCNAHLSHNASAYGVELHAGHPGRKPNLLSHWKHKRRNFFLLLSRL